MKEISAYLKMDPVTENESYNAQKRYEEPTIIPVIVNQVDYNCSGKTKRYRCQFPHGTILWVPLDALCDQYHNPLELED